MAGFVLAVSQPGGPARAETAPDPVCAPATSAADRLADVVFIGESAYLSDAVLAAIEGRFVGCSVTALDPVRVAEAVNAAYAAHPAPLAFARPVGVDDSTVSVELVEIRYEDIRVRGNDSTSAGYVIGRSGAEPGAPADVAALQRRLGAVPETDDIRIEADIEPGTALNTSDLILTVEEPPRFGLTATVDNWGPPETGRVQVGLTGTVRSLVGRRDNLTVAATGSQGARSIAGVYSVPVNPRGTRLALSAAYDESERIAGDPLLLGLRSDTLTLGASLANPLRAGDFGNDIVTAGVSHLVDGSVLAGFDIRDQATTEFSLGSRHVRRSPGRYSVTLSHDLVYGTTRDRIAADRFDYWRWNGSVGAVLRIAGPVMASIEGGWQLSGEPVASAVRFAATGPTVVRGYPATSGGGDAGFYLRNQVSAFRQFSPEQWPVDLEVTPYLFSDIGEAFNHGATGLQGNGLAHSVGAGIDLAVLSRDEDRRGLRGTVFVAMPLRDTTGFSADDPFVGVSMAVSF